jgi:hypothetical protein
VEINKIFTEREYVTKNSKEEGKQGTGSYAKVLFLVIGDR